jgi:mRNA interferase MazF
VVSPAELNDHLRTVIVAPMRSKGFAAPFRVALAHGGTKGLILLDQVRTMDRGRLAKKLGAVSAKTLSAALATARSLCRVKKSIVKNRITYAGRARVVAQQHYPHPVPCPGRLEMQNADVVDIGVRVACAATWLAGRCARGKRALDRSCQCRTQLPLATP